MKWSALGAGAVVATVVATVVLAALGAVSAKVAAGILQLLGIGLTLLGVAVVRSWLERATDTAVESKKGLGRWWALRRAQLGAWSIRESLRPPKLHRVSLTASMPYETTEELGGNRAERVGLSEREWLAALDSDIDAIHRRLRSSTHQLAAQGDELRDEISRETRQGWKLIVAGLVCSAVGTALGMAA